MIDYWTPKPCWVGVWVQAVCRGQETCEQVRELCFQWTLGYLIAGPFIAAPYFCQGLDPEGLSVEGAVVPVLLSLIGRTSFPGELLSTCRSSGCIYRCTSFSSLPSLLLSDRAGQDWQNLNRVLTNSSCIWKIFKLQWVYLGLFLFLSVLPLN